MSFALLRPVCQCPELKRTCPACIDFHSANKPWMHGNHPVRLDDLITTLVADHDTVVARVKAGDPYPDIANDYNVSIDTLMGYLIRTKSYIARQLMRRAYIHSLEPQILQDDAQGIPLRELATKYGVSLYSIRCMRQRARAFKKEQD